MNRLFTPFERMTKHQTTLDALSKAAVTCEAHFGPDAARPFRELQDVFDELGHAAGLRFHSRDGLEREEHCRVMAILYPGGDA